MVKPRLPLPEQFAWRRWSIGHIRHHKPGDPAPDAVIFELTINNATVARIMSLENSKDQWLVTVHAGLPKVHQAHGIAASEAQARAWCERWAKRELDYLFTRFITHRADPAKHAYTTLKQ